MAIRRSGTGVSVAVALATACGTGGAYAQCAGPGGFPSWLAEVKREAAAEGISADALAALDNVRYDQSVVDSDRRQGVFSQSFLEFAGRMVAQYRMDQGRQLLKKYQSTFDRIEAQ